ncbi:capsular polysaccharide biosynthesis protein [Gynuella sunshinyii]|uniref:Capsule polysaccharide export protein n=1 Tax=Gynuella sunshinyii YC6258 TaxID=1445510 RepID=A0A0C5V2Z3_9GAMM|nr:capsular polysaccharide biosynthesis protein [Gynuella sunshinyii]AJQ93890.1 capsule polysaccharide export protein [Gynuella sunshinyii YC6258]
MLGLTSRGIANIPFLSRFLGEGIIRIRRWQRSSTVRAIIGWGQRPSTRRSRATAKRLNVPFIALEDGLLRSFGTGSHFPPLSLVIDHSGIYYDANTSSDLEKLLNSDRPLLTSDSLDIKTEICRLKLSKYNHAPVTQLKLKQPAILVVDQTWGDMGVTLANADARTFQTMLTAAITENPDATIYIKTHPEVSSGQKAGYLTDIADTDKIIKITGSVNPMSLIEQADKVYVVSSTMGFEALLLNKPVSCFGLPWYAGWGVTDDRQHCPRRVRQRSIDELFSAAYLHYCRYLDPYTHQPGQILDVIRWLQHQRQMASQYSGRMIVIGWRRWRAHNLKPLLSLYPEKILFADTCSKAAKLQLRPDDCLLTWGQNEPEGLQQLSQAAGARVLRIEDGFIRSVGLGSDLIRPMSLVFDEQGVYFDPRYPSSLETILSHSRFDDKELLRAQNVRAFIVNHGISKYNVESRKPVNWNSQGKKILLVPGQVETDASILYGCTTVKTNLDLLKAARSADPDAFIVYKPHPDVMSLNRRGRLAMSAAAQWADHIETESSVVSCLDACHEVHTMTSLTGFDALLRNKKVVVYGQPFYAGWGLTVDKESDGIAFTRRQRKLSLDELVAGSLLRYPIYWDWSLNGYTSCESVLREIVEQRSALEHNGRLQTLQRGYLRRQGRKLRVLISAWTAKV